MTALNSLFNLLNRLLLGPFESLDPAWAMLFVALVAGVALLLGFRLLSRQKAVARAKAQVMSQLLAIRLFGNDPVMTVRLFGRMLLANLGYLKLTFPPFVILCIPILFLLVQLDLRYGRRPLLPGETTVLSIKLAGDANPDLRVHTGSGLALETPALRIPALSEQSWRLKALAPGLHQVRIESQGHSFTKEVAVGSTLLPAAPIRPGPGLFAALVHPWEPPLPQDLGVASVAVDYPVRDFFILGLGIDWVVAFFLLSLLFAFLLRKPLRVAL